MPIFVSVIVPVIVLIASASMVIILVSFSFAKLAIWTLTTVDYSIVLPMGRKIPRKHASRRALRP